MTYERTPKIRAQSSPQTKRDLGTILWAIDENMGFGHKSASIVQFISCLKTQKQKLYVQKNFNSGRALCKSGRAEGGSGRAQDSKGMVQHPQKYASSWNIVNSSGCPSGSCHGCGGTCVSCGPCTSWISLWVVSRLWRDVCVLWSVYILDVPLGRVRAVAGRVCLVVCIRPGRPSGSHQGRGETRVSCGLCTSLMSLWVASGLWRDVLLEGNIWGTVGCHPKSATDFTARAQQAMLHMLQHPKMMAVGEIGLDYSGTLVAPPPRSSAATLTHCEQSESQRRSQCLSNVIIQKVS